MSIAHRLFIFVTLLLTLTPVTLAASHAGPRAHLRHHPRPIAARLEDGPSFGPDPGTCEALHTCPRVAK